MKTNMNNLKKIFAVAMVLCCWSGAMAASAADSVLHVDSVTVDSVWVTDSSWYNGQGILQTRTSRDLTLSFVAMGTGMANVRFMVSSDSGKTWGITPNPLINLDSAKFDTARAAVMIGQKQHARLRMLGGDLNGVVVKAVCRQYAPQVANGTGCAGNPFDSVHVGENVAVSLAATRHVGTGLGFSAISKIWWDALGDGAWDDSTDALNWTWNTTVPQTGTGSVRGLVVKARDVNGLWSLPDTIVVQFGVTRLMKMIAIPGGTFLMGADSLCHTVGGVNLQGDSVHQVTLTAFSMSETDVTQEQYWEVTGTNPSTYMHDSVVSHSDSILRPVENVNWYDAVRFCNKLSSLSGKDNCYDISNSDSTLWACDFTKNGYRLPTEAEWEYAAKAGNDSCNYYWGNGSDTATLDAHAWNSHNNNGLPQPVATKPANGFSLYDMAGNVWQWCNDWYETYSSAAQNDPTGATTGYYRMWRGGGCYYDVATNYRSAFRYSYYFGGPDNLVGFRVVSLP